MCCRLPPHAFRGLPRGHELSVLLVCMTEMSARRSESSVVAKLFSHVLRGVACLFPPKSFRHHHGSTRPPILALAVHVRTPRGEEVRKAPLVSIAELAL